MRASCGSNRGKWGGWARAAVTWHQGWMQAKRLMKPDSHVEVIVILTVSPAAWHPANILLLAYVARKTVGHCCLRCAQEGGLLLAAIAHARLLLVR